MARRKFSNPQNGRQLEGVDTVMRNLNKEIKKIRYRSMKGLIKAAILIRRDMDTTPPLIPVDLGNLRASSFIVAGNGVTRTSGTFTGPYSAEFEGRHNTMLSKEQSVVAKREMVAIGFSAKYASIVEADTTTKRKRAGAGGGFFEGAIERNKSGIIAVIKKEAKKR